jgi:hypothetical protein
VNSELEHERGTGNPEHGTTTRPPPV